MSTQSTERGLLFSGERLVCELEVASSLSARTKGLIGRGAAEFEDAALLLVPARGVHTFGMKFALDVAYLLAEPADLPTSARSTAPTQPAACIRQPKKTAGKPRIAYRVRATTKMRPLRIGWVRRRCDAVLEAPEGSFERWKLKVGDVVQSVQHP